MSANPKYFHARVRMASDPHGFQDLRLEDFLARRAVMPEKRVGWLRLSSPFLALASLLGLLIALIGRV